MTGRSVETWVGSTPDAAIPARVRLRVFDRCKGVCALSGHKIMPGDQWDLDHIKPLSMGGQHAEDNLQVVWRPAHREKTSAEAGPRAKADRIRAKHLGLHKPRSRLSHPTLRKKLSGEVVSRCMPIRFSPIATKPAIRARRLPRTRRSD